MNKRLELSLPGKVFIAGEYLVLHQGSCLIANIGPRFILSAAIGVRNQNKLTENVVFHPDSPAGKLWKEFSARGLSELANPKSQEQESFLDFLQLKFFDARNGQGGLGASSAQFLALYSIMNLKSAKEFLNGKNPGFISEVLAAFRKASQQKDENYSASGADLVGQLVGGICYWNPQQQVARRTSWPFENLLPLFGKTLHKVKTHEHLSLLPEFSSQGLAQIFSNIERAFVNCQKETFTRHISEYGQELKRLNLVAPSTNEILNELSTIPGLVAKGCGAMGADVVLVLVDQEELSRQQAESSMMQAGLEILGGSEIISDQGLHILEQETPIENSIDTQALAKNGVQGADL